MHWTKLFLAALLAAVAAACSAHPAAPEPGAAAASAAATQGELPAPAASQTRPDSVQVTGEAGIVGSVGG